MENVPSRNCGLLYERSLNRKVELLVLLVLIMLGKKEEVLSSKGQLISFMYNLRNIFFFFLIDEGYYYRMLGGFSVKAVGS